MRLATRQLLAVALLILGCGGGGSGTSTTQEAGAFLLLDTNVVQGSVWPLNKAITLEFNRAIDPGSVSFASVILRPLDPKQPPVTGLFEIDSKAPHRLIFRPSCPTNASFDNGGLKPGGRQYEVGLPVGGGRGSAVVRDRAGRGLSRGFFRRFRTPVAQNEALFLDTVSGPPRLLAVDFPAGLNLFTAPAEDVVLHFDQAVDPRPTNLNRDRIVLLYSKDTIRSGLPLVFPPENRIPGQLVSLENCAKDGARLLFQLTGILPPDRELRLLVKAGFSDLVGERTIADQVWLPHGRTPTLMELYRDPSWLEEEQTHDEFQESFDGTRNLDPQFEQALPLAKLEAGYVEAAFDFPGQFVPPEASFELRNLVYQEVNTLGEVLISDSNNRVFLVRNGVMNVHDLKIEAGSSLRARGPNPLVIYASGEVVIDGRLDVSGNHANRPSGIINPSWPEGRGPGECGGGHGGQGSYRTDAETRRGENGDGPFGLKHVGGQGGESALNQANSGFNGDCRHGIAAGGGGGTFALTPNAAIRWDRWVPPKETGYGADTQAADIQNKGGFYPPEQVLGGEAGIRGGAFKGWETNPNLPHGTYGMEDLQPDPDADELAGFNPPGDVFKPGDPVRGPDGGLPGASIFRDDGWSGNDFWGRRRNTDGSVTVGELLVPWAGSGGGAGGDTQFISRRDLDFDGTLEPLTDFFPYWVPPVSNYYKGTGGGGGGGQLLLLAIGTIRIGPAAVIQANGGVGTSGVSMPTPTFVLDHQVSGSGGGSGGHVVLHTARKLDLSAIDVGQAKNAAQVSQLEDVASLRAIGGRRGWAMSAFDPDGQGNGDFMAGRGGAGGNGVIQIHVSDPARDILWPANADKGIRDYLFDGDPLANPLDVDRLEEVLALFAAPRPYALVPFFGARSQVHSRWIDTGLAGVRAPAGAPGPWPDWADSFLRLQGIVTSGPTSGQVEVDRERVRALDAVARGAYATANFQAYECVLDDASLYLAPPYLRNPLLMQGYDLWPNASAGRGFEVVSASYDRGMDQLQLQTSIADGPMTLVLQAGQAWELRPKFFRVVTEGLRDSLPDSTRIVLDFQAAAESSPGSGEPGPPVPAPGQWTAELASLQGLRFIRYRLTFDIDAQERGADLSSPRPRVEYLKLPFAW